MPIDAIVGGQWGDEGKGKIVDLLSENSHIVARYQGGSNAGHNGIDSIDKNIGKNYSRIRIGIGRPKDSTTGADHVLDNFSNNEKQYVEKVTNNIIESLSILIKKDLDLFSSKINQS